MRRVVKIAALVGAVAALVAAAVYGPPALRAMRIGTGYMAKQICSCVFVAGRDAAACAADMPASMERIRYAVDADGVRARVLFGLVERQALHHPGSGCTLHD